MTAISARFRVALLACVMLACNAGCGTDDSAPGDQPRYTDESGEEVFGPEYRPRSPSIASAPLLVGTPNAGALVPESLKGLEQQELLKRMKEPVEAGGIEESQRGPGIPLLKSHDSGGVAERFSEARKASAPPQRRMSGNTSMLESAEDALESGGPPRMTAHFVFVGQGDGAILEFPCGVAVIDTGGERKGGDRVNGGALFVEYLTQFFADRPQFDDTIDVLFTTHPHADHLDGLPLLTNADGTLLFDVRNVVDNGQTADSGSMGKQTKFRQAVTANGGEYSAVEFARQVAATGATNAVIDPFDCADVDPIITAFWGGLNEELPADELLSTSEYGTPNNHSVVIRIDFGDASFIFTGDLEDRGERDLRNQYEGNHGVFDVDVYQVSHHGADDDTSDEFLEIMTPNIAVISMGTSLVQSSSTAWDHGHPRTGLLAVLQEEPGVVLDFRDPAEEFPAAPAQETDFQDTSIERAIFGTGWEGSILIEANTDGEYEIFTE